MTDLPATAGSGRGPGGAQPGLIRRRDLVAALDRAAQKRVTIISAPAGTGETSLLRAWADAAKRRSSIIPPPAGTGKTSLLRAWADRPGRDCGIAFVTVRPGQ